jgi:hypothetical protein
MDVWRISARTDRRATVKRGADIDDEGRPHLATLPEPSERGF